MIVELARDDLPRHAYAYTGGVPWPSAPPTRCVVFVHGAMHDHSVWTLLARWFAHHGHAALAVDLPGHGRSDGPPLPSVEALGAWLLAVLDALHVARASIAGHSMGSLVALEAAAQAPTRVGALALVGTAWPMKVSPALLATARTEPARAIAMVDAFSHSSLAAKPSYPGPGAWLRGANRALMQRMQDIAAPWGNLFEHDFRVCDAYARGATAAAAVTCPAHLVLGQRDVMTPPRAAQALAQALGQGSGREPSTIHVAAGHALMQEAPDEVLRALRLAFDA
ncbi:MAG TPA: alpha/beta fold hydrolase [Burkholderiaceae bacterium]|jgi:pimeloyl-ACP methyl ester carboxylesterase|nr:alpha/beta fold hydrolase [Burkholderiaceae bacterium]